MTTCVNAGDGGGGKKNDPVYEFINGQSLEPYNSMPYGNSTIGDAGCEAIACYNALIELGKGESFASVVAFFTENFYLFPASGWTQGGHLGASPDDIAFFLDSREVKYTRMYMLDDILMPLKLAYNESCGLAKGVYILSYWNKDYLHYGYHTIAVKCDGYKYTAYNWKTDINEAISKDSIFDYTYIDSVGYFGVLSVFYIPYAQN